MAKDRPRRRRRWLITALVLLALAGAAWFAVPPLLQRIVRDKLHAEVSEHLNADLRIGSLHYSFPYSVRAADVRLVSTIDGTELISADAIEFSLAQLPLGEGPLLIEKIAIDRPQVELIHKADGTFAGTGLVKERAVASPSSVKLSDRFRLRLLSLREGRVRYTDQSQAQPSAMAWERLSTELHLAPVSASAYGWDISAASGAVADVSGAGTIDIDQLLLEISKLTINARADGDASSSPLPAPVQDFLRELGVRGSARFQANAQIPLRDLQAMHAEATLLLIDAKALVRGSLVSGDMDVAVDRQANDPTVRIRLRRLSVTTEGGRMELADVKAQFDPVTRQLKAEPIAGTYGADRFALSAAPISLPPENRRVALRELAATIDFHQPGPQYPRALSKILNVLKPSGPFEVRGDYVVVPDSRDECQLTITTKGGALAVGKDEKRLPISDLDAEARVTAREVQIPRLVGAVLDGKITAAGSVTLENEPKYQGEIRLEQVDVAKLPATGLVPSGHEKLKLSGRGAAQLTFHGQGKSLAALHADGRARIVDGQLWEIPLLRGIVSRIKIGRGALTAGSAAGIFSIDDAKAQLHRAALNSPALGLQGSGTIGFDGQLDLNIIAALLGDWKQKLKQTGIPLVSTIAGEIAGGIQSVIGLATRKLLYQYRVKGEIGNPRIEAVPVPILTDTAVKVFEKMLREEEDLLDSPEEKKH